MKNPPKHKFFVGTLLTAGLFLSACGTGGTSNNQAPAPSVTSSSSTATGSASPSVSSADLSTSLTEFGEVIVGKNGRTVYIFTNDVRDSKRSNCMEGQCRSNWPPVLASSDNPIVEGITAKVGVIEIEDGKKQVTINGMPIYYWNKDTRIGEAKGQDVSGSWYVVSPAGEIIKLPVAVPSQSVQFKPMS